MIVPNYKLVELGFERHVYEKQIRKPVFFRKLVGSFIIEVSDDGNLGQWADQFNPDCVEGSSFERFDLRNEHDADLFAKFVAEQAGIDITTGNKSVFEDMHIVKDVD